MSDTADEEQRRRPHAKPAAEPYLELDLMRELEALHREPEWKSGHNARTLVKLDNLRVVLVALKARSRIPTHQTEGRISIHTVQGRIQVQAEGRTFNLPAGNLVVLDQGLRHDAEALEDSAFLLTVAWPSDADLVVIGAPRRWTSTTHAVLSRSLCPVLVTHDARPLPRPTPSRRSARARSSPSPRDILSTRSDVSPSAFHQR